MYPDLLKAIAAAPVGELRAKDIGRALGPRSPNSRARWITRAVDAGLIEATKQAQFDPAIAYRLTDAGRAQLGRPTRTRD